MKDEFFNDVWNSVFNGPMYGGETFMKTDIIEMNGRYYLDIELPGYTKENVKISLYNGELTIMADAMKPREGKLLRQERYNGGRTRTFRVSNALKETDIHAVFTDGILTIDFPTEAKKEEEEKKYISIL